MNHFKQLLMMKYYILFGPPGAGKGTHAGAISEKYNLKHVSTGELLRAEIAAGSPLGLQAKALIDAGALVPDEIVVEVGDKNDTEGSNESKTDGETPSGTLILHKTQTGTNVKVSDWKEHIIDIIL